MERQVKERLIGAAVLVALAVILIPELLSGPERTEEPAVARREQPIKTYEFDLDGNTAARPARVENAAPPAEIESPGLPSETPPSTKPASTTAAQHDTPRQPEPAPPISTPVASAPAEQSPARVEPTPPRVAPEPERPAPARPEPPIQGGWAVQLGSFADEQRARVLMERMQGQGHRAYLVPLQRADGQRLQRVRIGPFPDKAAAEQALSRLGEAGRGAAVVTQ